MSPEPSERKYFPLALQAYFNNDGISYYTDRLDGDFDGQGNTYPAEALPASNEWVVLKGVPLLFPDKSDGALNNLALEEQEISIFLRHYHTLTFLGAADSGRYADGGYVDPLTLFYADRGEEKVLLRLKDWLCIPEQRSGGYSAWRCPYMHTPQGIYTRSERNYETHPTLWFEEVAVDPSRCLKQIVLPDNPCMHLFALTLVADA